MYILVLANFYIILFLDNNMKPNKEKRAIYWNVRAESPPDEVHTWYFLVFNELKMIDRIRQRIFAQLKPVENITTYCDETIKGKDLRVLCFSCESPTNELRGQKEIYDGKWRKDDELYQRPGLESLIDRRISGN